MIEFKHLPTTAIANLRVYTGTDPRAGVGDAKHYGMAGGFYDPTRADPAMRLVMVAEDGSEAFVTLPLETIREIAKAADVIS